MRADTFILKQLGAVRTDKSLAKRSAIVRALNGVHQLCQKPGHPVVQRYFRLFQQERAIPLLQCPKEANQA